MIEERLTFGSLTRISDLERRPFDRVSIDRDRWATGDYVVGEVLAPAGPLARVELPTGRMRDVVDGDRVVGVLGRRHATLETVGDWREIGSDGVMEALTAAGLFGRATSRSTLLPSPFLLRYRGHVLRDSVKVTMADFGLKATGQGYDRPTVLIVGTSMSAGKTLTAKVLVRELKRRGLRIVGTKLTGAGRYRDILAMMDFGADVGLDFVDCGLASTVCPRELYRTRLAALLKAIDAADPDVVVAEAGASPFEPYNGDTVLDQIGDQVRCTILAASDPYAVVGVMKGFDLVPDLVTGIATSTDAGIELIEKLTGVPALNLLDPASRPRLASLVERSLDI